MYLDNNWNHREWKFFSLSLGSQWLVKKIQNKNLKNLKNKKSKFLLQIILKEKAKRQSQQKLRKQEKQVERTSVCDHLYGCDSRAGRMTGAKRECVKQQRQISGSANYEQI